jgi:signal transduction histidine kinase
MALHEFIQSNRGQIIECCRLKAASRRLTPLTGPAMEHGVPLFLDQLSSALRLGLATSPDISLSASRHGHDLLHQGYSLSQVVHDYGDVCQAITELAADAGAVISTDDFRVLNRCLDDAIAGAVTEYGRERNESEVEGESARGNERLGFFAHEMRNLINTAIVAFEVLKTGNVGVAGSTGTVLQRSLAASRALIGRSLAEIRLTQGITSREQFPVSELLGEIAAAAQLDAQSRGVHLNLAPIASDVVIEGDRQVITSVVGNLVQNGLKFTRPGTLVALKAHATLDRVCIEIEDRCGGLPSENIHELFRPFEQRGGDRTGVGLGLAFSRWGAEANGGQVHARSLPGVGCVFTVDLPRLSLPAVSARPA